RKNPTLMHEDHLHASYFADGGIVTSPTLGVVGEAGPEAIVPLDQELRVRVVNWADAAADVSTILPLDPILHPAFQPPDAQGRPPPSSAASDVSTIISETGAPSDFWFP